MALPQPFHQVIATNHQCSPWTVQKETALVKSRRAVITRLLKPYLSSAGFSIKRFALISFHLARAFVPLLLFLVTTSWGSDSVIFVLAAFHGCASGFSGFCSVIPHPQSVIRHHYGQPPPYHDSWYVINLLGVSHIKVGSGKVWINEEF